jgi:hypothetical protein
MMIIPVGDIIVVAAVLVMIVTAIANRPQEVIEGLVGIVVLPSMAGRTH